jgi:mono/diheme cytochrome c family protein
MLEIIMRIFFHFLLYTSFFMAVPFSIQAAAGPEGHHHDHDPEVKPHTDHSNSRSTLMDPNHAGHDDGGHDHGAHAWQAPEAEKKRPNPVAASAESIANGQRIFRHYCITCHGYNADGDSMRGRNLNPQAANLREMAGHHSDGDYHYKIRTGHGPMPHWENTIDAENTWHLVNYLQSLKPQKASTDGHDQHRHPEAEKTDHHDHSSHTH